MARRRWVERDHPRHPGESPGGVGGRFRERVGSGGWATRLNSMLARRDRGGASGRSDLGDTSRSDLRRALAESDADYARGISPRERAIMDERMDEGGNLPRLTNQEVAQALSAQANPDRIRSALRARVSSEGRLGARITEEDLAALNDAIINEVIEQTRGEITVNPLPAGMSFEEQVVDTLAELLRRFSPDELWPHLL